MATKRKGRGKTQRKEGAVGDEGVEEIVVVEGSAVVGEAPEPEIGETEIRSFEPAGSGAKKDRFLPISIIAAAVLIGGAVVFASMYRGGSTAGQQPQGNSGAPSAVNTSSIMKLGPRDEVLGDANAPVTIVEYGDYQCPFCTRFFSQTEPQIISNYVNSGKVRMVFRDFPFLGQESVAAAEAAQCANDQNKLWPYHDALYSAKVSDENNGGGENDGYFTRTLFLSLARKVGLNMQTFTSCIDGNKDAGIVTAEKTAATSDGVDSTPTFFVNGTEVLGAQPYSSFQSVIDTALAGK